MIVEAQAASCRSLSDTTLGAGGAVTLTSDGTYFVGGYSPKASGRVVATSPDGASVGEVRDHYYLIKLPDKVERDTNGFAIMPQIALSQD